MALWIAANASGAAYYGISFTWCTFINATCAIQRIKWIKLQQETDSVHLKTHKKQALFTLKGAAFRRDDNKSEF